MSHVKLDYFCLENFIWGLGLSSHRRWQVDTPPGGEKEVFMTHKGAHASEELLQHGVTIVLCGCRATSWMLEGTVSGVPKHLKLPSFLLSPVSLLHSFTSCHNQHMVHASALIMTVTQSISAGGKAFYGHESECAGKVNKSWLWCVYSSLSCCHDTFVACLPHVAGMSTSGPRGPLSCRFWIWFKSVHH